MRIALTGSSSTGKTTLLNDLLETDAFRVMRIKSIHLDTRQKITEMDIRADGTGTDCNRRREFQWKLLTEKTINEKNEFKYITDRSAVDLAAYWIVRDSEGVLDMEGKKYLAECKAFAMRYDLHIHLPCGLIPFIEDGQRPVNEIFNKQVSETVRQLLDEWELNYISLSQIDRIERVNRVTSEIEETVRSGFQDEKMRTGLIGPVSQFHTN